MNLFNLKDNALFLQNWRERMRPSYVISAFILTAIIVFLIFMSAVVNDHYYYIYADQGQSYSSSKRIPFPWYSEALYNIAFFQGVVLLVFGTIASAKMSYRERQSGTLEFHRSSPTPRSNQVFGLLFGAPSLEWCISHALFLISCILIFITPLSFLAYLQFYAALSLCACFYHAIANVIGLSAGAKNSKAGIISTAIGGYFFLHILVFASFMMSFAYHLTWIPAYQELSIHLKGFEHLYYHQKQYYDTYYMQFGYKIHSFLYQLFVQVPLMAVALSAIKRRISNPDNPLLTKGQTLLTIFFILFIYTGSVFSIIVTSTHTYMRHYNFQFIQFFYLMFFLSIIGVLINTPTQLQFLKGLRKIKKLGLAKMGSGEDYSSNAVWTVTLCFLLAVIFSLYIWFFKIHLSLALYGFCLVMAHIAFFAAFVEYYRLSQFHNTKAVFWTIIIILWAIIPIFGSILASFMKNSLLVKICLASSPFTGGVTLAADIVLKPPYKHIDNHVTFLLVPALFMMTAMFLAHSQKSKLQKSVLEG